MQSVQITVTYWSHIILTISMDRRGVGWCYPTENRMGSFHSISGMELEEHDSEDICFTPPASHIEKILRKYLHGWMFDNWVIGLREDNYVNRPFPSFENSLF